MTRTNSVSLIHVGSLKFESLYNVVALSDSRSRTWISLVFLWVWKEYDDS